MRYRERLACVPARSRLKRYQSPELTRENLFWAHLGLSQAGEYGIEEWR